MASVSGGHPAPRTTWRAGAWPTPAEMTWPMNASSMSVGWIPARDMAALAAAVPSWGAVREARPPWNFPMGVRAAERMTTSWTNVSLIHSGALWYV